MSLFENTLEQIDNAAELMSLDAKMKSILSNPQRIVEVNIPVEMDNGELKIFKGFRVQHNNYRGPYKGGIRYHQQVDMEEVKALSAWMSIKCSVVGIPLGGGKGGIVVNPKELSQGELERLTRAYVRLIAPVIGPKTDVPAPDVNTNAQVMEWIADEYSKIVGQEMKGVVTGKPLDKGGSKGRDVATAQGGAYVLEELAKETELIPAETKVIVQGFGNAGSVMARLLVKAGYHVIGVSDSRGGLICSHGIDPESLMQCKIEKSTVSECWIEMTDLQGVEGANCRKVTNEELLEEECDVLVLAALENQITKNNADKVKAKIIIELANGPIAPGGDEILNKKGVTVVPDILANAGGVTVSYFEMIQNADDNYWSEDEVLEKLKGTMVQAWSDVKSNSEKYDCSLREAAFITAIEKIEAAAKERENL